MEFSINRGIGRSAEFGGLKSKYLFICAGGLLCLFVLLTVFFIAGLNHTVCIIFGVAAAVVLVYGSIRLNEKYGEHGLMKVQAKRNHPRFVINRRRIPLLFQLRIKNYGLR